MMSVKEEALKAINSLPENALIDEVMYRLYVIDKVSRGQTAVANGEILTTEELQKEISSW